MRRGLVQTNLQTWGESMRAPRIRALAVVSAVLLASVWVGCGGGGETSVFDDEVVRICTANNQRLSERLAPLRKELQGQSLEERAAGLNEGLAALQDSLTGTLRDFAALTPPSDKAQVWSELKTSLTTLRDETAKLRSDVSSQPASEMVAAIDAYDQSPAGRAFSQAEKESGAAWAAMALPADSCEVEMPTP